LRATKALLARVWPALELTVVDTGADVPPAKELNSLLRLRGKDLRPLVV